MIASALRPIAASSADEVGIGAELLVQCRDDVAQRGLSAGRGGARHAHRVVAEGVAEIQEPGRLGAIHGREVRRQQALGSERLQLSRSCAGSPAGRRCGAG